MDAILSAKKSVNIAVQELRLPRIAKALATAKHRGLDVRVVLENKYNHTLLTSSDPDGEDINQHEASRFVELFALVDMDGDGRISLEEMNERDAVHILRNHKVPVKDDTHDGSMGSGLMHHKFVVIDGKTVILSTANFTTSGTHGDFLNPRTTGNANSLIKMDSVELATIFNQEFYTMWGGPRGAQASRFGIGKGYRGPRSARIGRAKVVAQFSPTSRVFGWESSVNGLIGKALSEAKREVLMALFVFSDQYLGNILEAKQSTIPGFKIGLMVEPKFAYRNYSEMLDMWGLSLLDENCSYEENNTPWKVPLRNIGVPNLENGDMLHHKFAVVDSETVIVGSQNWSNNANLQNDENVIVIKSKELAKSYTQEFRRLERYSRKGPPNSLLSRIKNMADFCAQ